MRKRNPGLAAILLLLLCFSSVEAVFGAVTQTIRTTGTGVIVGQDQASAFEQAKKAALREAVEQAAGTLVTSSTQVASFVAVQDDIRLQTTGYVRRYVVVSQGAMDSHTYQVTLDAEVDLGQLHRQLEAMNLLIDAAGDPPLLCLGKEVVVTDHAEEVAWGVVAEQLEKGLKSASSHFSLVTPWAGQWQEAGALELARSQGAEVLVTGKATVRSLPSTRIPSGGDLKELGISSAAAEVVLKLMWVDTGEVVATLTQRSRAADRSFEAAARKAVRQGVESLTAELVKTLLADWRDKVYSGREVQLQVQASADQLRQFERDFPISVGGIDALYPRGFSAGIARYDARAHSQGFQIARELSAKGLGDLNVEILLVTNNTLQLKLSD